MRYPSYLTAYDIETLEKQGITPEMYVKQKAERTAKQRADERAAMNAVVYEGATMPARQKTVLAPPSPPASTWSRKLTQKGAAMGMIPPAIRAPPPVMSNVQTVVNLGELDGMTVTGEPPTMTPDTVVGPPAPGVADLAKAYAKSSAVPTLFSLLGLYALGMRDTGKLMTMGAVIYGSQVVGGTAWTAYKIKNPS